ncbi:hypothetical protein, partial [Nocardioides sp. ChNu-99]
LTVLTHGVPETERPDANALRPLRYALSRYLSAAADSGWPRDVEPPPAPSLETLREAGVPLVATEILRAALDAEADRRVRLHRLVLSDGWSWPVP